MSEAVAHGSLVLSLDSSQLNQGLSKAAKDAKNKGKSFAENFKAGSEDLLKDATGGDKGIVGGLGKAGAIGAGIAGAAMLGESLWKAFGPAKDLKKELEALADANDEWRENVKKSIDMQTAWIDSLDDIAGTAEGAARISQHYDQIGGSAEQLNERLKKAKEGQEEWDSWGNWEGWSAWLTGGHEDRAKALDEEAKKLKEEAKAAKDSAEAHKKKAEMQRISADKGTREFVQGMKDAADIARGALDTDLARIEAMKRSNPMLTEAQVSEMRMAVAMKNAAEEAKKLREEQEAAAKEGADLARSLEEELGLAVKRSSEEAKLDELIQKGIDENQANRLRELIALKKAEGQQYKPLNALVKGTAAEISFQNKSRFDQQKDAATKALIEENKKQSKILADIRDAALRERRPPEL